MTEWRNDEIAKPEPLPAKGNWAKPDTTIPDSAFPEPGQQRFRRVL